MPLFHHFVFSNMLSKNTIKKMSKSYYLSQRILFLHSPWTLSIQIGSCHISHFLYFWLTPKWGGWGQCHGMYKHAEHAHNNCCCKQQYTNCEKCRSTCFGPLLLSCLQYPTCSAVSAALANTQTTEHKNMVWTISVL